MSGNVVSHDGQFRPEPPAGPRTPSGASDGALLARLGTDGAKWAAAFVAAWTRLAFGGQGRAILVDPSPGEFLHGWFCNAIEAGRSAAASDSTDDTARYRFAIKEVRRLRVDTVTGFDPDADLNNAFNRALDEALAILAAALGDGETDAI